MYELTGIALLRTMLPEEFTEQLRLIATNWRKDKFAIGDIRNSLKAMVGERCLPITTADIDEFLSDCLNHDVEPRTVRYYAMVADAFPYSVRDEFSTLSFAHFAFAQSFGKEAKEVLFMAKDREETTGRVPSIDWLRAAHSGYIYEQQSGDFPTNMPFEAPAPDVDLPPAPEPAPEPELEPVGWLNGLHRAVRFSIDHIDAVPLQSEQRKRLLDLLAQVDSLLEQYIIVR